MMIPVRSLAESVTKIFCRNDRQSVLDLLDTPIFHAPQKTLVVVISSTRGKHLSWHNFNRNVLRVLGADLALAISDLDNTTLDAYRSAAQYVWQIKEPLENEYMPLFHEISMKCFGHVFDDNYAYHIGRVNAQTSGWLGCIKSARQPRSCSAQIIFYRYFALQQILDKKLYLLYDKVVITRSDFVWLQPHDDISEIKRGELWVPQAKDYGGIYDRHHVFTMYDAINGLDLIDAVFERPNPIDQQGWLKLNGFNYGKGNLETAQFRWLFDVKKMKEKRFKHSGFLAIDVHSSKQSFLWSPPVLVDVGGYVIMAKYRDEVTYLIDTYKTLPITILS